MGPGARGLAQVWPDPMPLVPYGRLVSGKSCCLEAEWEVSIYQTYTDRTSSSLGLSMR